MVSGREEQRRGEEDLRKASAQREIVMIKSEMWIEQRVFNSRFQTLVAVVGSLLGATLCFLRGSMLVMESVGYAFRHLMSHHCSRVIMYLLEALDVYLMGTVMLIFGMGLYELFITPLEVAPEGGAHPRSSLPRSSLFGLYPLKQKPKWLEINSLDELKTKLGQMIVTIMVVAMFEKSKKVSITTAQDFFLIAASTAMAAGCMLFLSKMSGGHEA